MAVSLRPLARLAEDEVRHYGRLRDHRISAGLGAVRTPLANIKIATFDGERLRYAGAVGTGFSEGVAASLRARFDLIRAERCPIAGLKGKGTVWVSPDLRARVAYRGVTTAGELRHASFKGLME